MHVVVDIYSGVANPEFDLDDEERDRVRALLSDLPAAERAPAPPPPLGYRGFLVRDAAPGAPETEVRVHRTSVEVRVGASGQVVHRHDTGRDLERVLIEGARRHLGPAALPDEAFEQS